MKSGAGQLRGGKVGREAIVFFGVTRIPFPFWKTGKLPAVPTSMGLWQSIVSAPVLSTTFSEIGLGISEFCRRLPPSIHLQAQHVGPRVVPGRIEVLPLAEDGREIEIGEEHVFAARDGLDQP